MDPFLSAHANDEEVEGMLDRFKVTFFTYLHRTNTNRSIAANHSPQTNQQTIHTQWPARTVDDIDGQLSQQLRQLERETIEVLLSWETRAKQEDTTTTTAAAAVAVDPKAAAGGKGGKGKTAAAPVLVPPAPAPVVVDPTSRGYLSTLQLVGMLDDLEGELETMEAWLSGKGDALKFMQADMLEIEAVSAFLYYFCVCVCVDWL
jgi:hypothetical protein